MAPFLRTVRGAMEKARKPFGFRAFLATVVAWDGIEPSTRGFSIRFHAFTIPKPTAKPIKIRYLTEINRNRAQSLSISSVRKVSDATQSRL